MVLSTISCDIAAVLGARGGPTQSPGRSISLERPVSIIIDGR
jgi:hypothetical protein